MSQLTLLYSRRQIATRIQRLADELNRDYAGRELLVVGVLKGAFIFVSDLVRQLHRPLVLDFVAVSSYGSGKESSQRVRITADLRQPVEGTHLLIVDDIIDTGSSALFLQRHLWNRRPASLRTCFLIDKSERRKVASQPDYVGFELSGGFVVGYGMDHAERYRNLPDIYRVD